MEKTLIVMRGLPWCGKSYRAKELSGEAGVIFSTDEYFHVKVKPHSPETYDFNPNVLHHAHRWNQERACQAMDDGHPLVIIDNTNTTPKEPRPYVEHALARGYEVRIEEPTSDRWQEIRELLLDTKKNKNALKEWAVKLEEGSRETHNVPAWSLEKMMWRWVPNLTVEKILFKEGD